MARNVIDIRKHIFSNQDRLLLDTNVWLHIYADKTNPSPTTKIYTQAFQNMLNAKSLLFIDAIIFSEFISNYVRLNNLKKAKKFKEFRDSKEFSEIAKKVAVVSRDILQHCQRIDNNFLTLDVDKLLTAFEQSHSDIKDQLILEVCKNNHLILVTDDGDFKNSNFKILTANQNLLTG